MNRIYRHIWSKTLGRMVVVPECAKGGSGRKTGRRRRRRTVVALAAAAGFIIPAAPGIAATSWTNGNADSDWNDPANWSNGLPVNNSGTTTYIGDVSSDPAIIDGVVTVGSGRTWVGSPTGDGRVVVRGGGSLAAGTFELLGTNGFAGYGVVSGLNSTITASSNFIGAYSGTGHLLIENGGSLTASSGHLGQYDGSLGTLTVTGTGSLYDVNYLDIGGTGGGSYSATGILTIANNGVVDVDSAIRIAEFVGTTGIVNIGAAEGDAAQAAGIIQSNGYELRFGAGSASLVFNHTDNAYSFSTPITGTGQLRQLAGTTILSGANTWSGLATVEGGELRAGGAGTLSSGNPFVVNGGTLNFNGFNHTIAELSGTGGMVALGSSTLTVNQASNTSYAGVISGSGGLTKSGTGALTLTGASSYSGGTIVRQGTLRINGGSVTHTSTDMVAGYAAGDDGALTIENGGTLESWRGIIGYFANSEGIATVTGENSTWTNTGDLLVGQSGEGALIVENGGLVTANVIIAGHYDGSEGTIRVEGGDSRMTSASLLRIGDEGKGNLLVAGGGAPYPIPAMAS